MKAAAIYARVSSEQQKEENTIASQTAALIEFAREQGYGVPDEWVVEDEGFSGASLLRPGLERLRDLAAEGHIQAVLIHAPDRLSRKYAYQVLLTEEFARHGVETIFLKAPHSGTPEDQLMLQFQGMIAEYERAQILERSRRGKRHRAKAGEVSVLGGAPYGYRYIRKTRDAPARYEIDAVEAEVVRLVYDMYTVKGLSIGAIAGLLREMGPPTRRRVTRWERSVVWAILRNPAYKGAACFNKTQVGRRQKVTRPFRLSGRAVHGEKSCSHERPRDEWIEIPVPAIVSDETFALAAERLADNKRFAPRRTIEPSIVQGLVSCRKCGYALSRTSTRSSARKIHYYRCLGSDAWRHLGGSVCDCRPIRQDLLDQIVWQEVVRLIEDPTLIQAELDRRLDAARGAEPTKRRQDALEREQTRIRKSMERLVTAYQEDLLPLDELRRRMPELRAREQSARAELQAILDQAADRMSFLRLAETLAAFLQRLHESAQSLEIADRQKIVRLLVKDILVDNDTITIRHSIPSHPRTPPPGTEPPSDGKSQMDGQGYLLRSGSDLTLAGEYLHAPVRVGMEDVRARANPRLTARDLRRRPRDPVQKGQGRSGLATTAGDHGQAEADGERGEDAHLQSAGGRVRLPGLHVRADVFGEDRPSPYRLPAVKEKHSARGRESPRADRAIMHMARDHDAGGQSEPHAARMGELLLGRRFQQGVSGARCLRGDAVAPVVALQAQRQATQGRELSTLAPLRALRARASDPAWARRAVDEGVRSCPRAGCGKSARPVR